MSIICFGEALIDFVEEEGTYIKCAGGAPLNTAIGLARLEVPVSFWGVVGNDSFGQFLKKTLVQNGVDVSNLHILDSRNTGLVFVNLDEEHKPHFEFIGKNPAHAEFSINHINETDLKEAKIFHLTSIPLLDEPIHSTTLECLRLAKEYGVMVSYDPNIRKHLFRSEYEIEPKVKEIYQYVDFLKLNEEEYYFLGGVEDLEAGVKSIMSLGPKIVCITFGSKGSYMHNGSVGWHAPAVQVRSVDTTGAGDGFMAGVLYGLYNIILDEESADLEGAAPLGGSPFTAGFSRREILDDKKMIRILNLANKIAALTTTSKGAINALPFKEDLE